MKKLISLCLTGLVALSLGVSALAADMFGNTPAGYYVVDEADVLTDAQEAELEAMGIQISNQYGHDIVLYFADELHGRTSQELADDYFDYSGYGQGSDRRGQLLMISPYTRDYAFSGRGESMDMFDSARLSVMESDAVSYLRDNDWYNAGVVYFADCRGFLEEGMPQKKLPFYMLPIDLILGFLAALVPVGGMKRQLKSVEQRCEASAYVKDEEILFTHNENRFINMVVSRRRIEQSSSSGGNGRHVSSSGATHSGRSGKF